MPRFQDGNVQLARRSLADVEAWGSMLFSLASSEYRPGSQAGHPLSLTAAWPTHRPVSYMDFMTMMQEIKWYIPYKRHLPRRSGEVSNEGDTRPI